MNAMKAKRVCDFVVSGAAIIVTAPVIIMAAIAIRLSSRGPVFYRALRVGKDGQLFRMHKLRTMVTAQGANQYAITATRDPRIFPVGRLLRISKVDELPQFIDVIRGKMSIVGPRPEDPRIVEDYYNEDGFATLTVRPGMTSPGTLFYYAVEHSFLAGGNPELAYVKKLLPVKLRLDAEYVRSITFGRDLRIVIRTLKAILLALLGKKDRIPVPELHGAGMKGIATDAIRAPQTLPESVSNPRPNLVQ